MKIKHIKTGSKGNCTFIEINNTKILIDAGVKVAKVRNELLKDKISLSEIDFIFITHLHLDHCKYLKEIQEKSNADVIILDKHYGKLGIILNIDKLKILPTKSMMIIINGIKVFYHQGLHDDVTGVTSIFKFYYEKTSYLHITDIGFLDTLLISWIQNTTHLSIEANYNERMLKKAYPEKLVNRISGLNGHLNQSEVLSVLYDTKFKGKLYLIHISENANDYNKVNKYFKKFNPIISTNESGLMLEG